MNHPELTKSNNSLQELKELNKELREKVRKLASNASKSQVKRHLRPMNIRKKELL